MPISFVIFICLFGFWFYTEHKFNATIRVLSGLACIVFLAFQLFGLTFKSGYESKYTKRSIFLAGELLATGETQRVQQAIQTYNKAASNSTYQAAEKMLDVLTQPAPPTNQPPSRP